MKDTSYIYFSIYENIEKEVIKLASAIYFSDDHLHVYSSSIAELIIRCSIELESIAKQIYRREKNLEPNSPGECFKWMEDNWKISKKTITIVSPYFHFSKEFKPNFCPFNYIKNSNEDYYSRYNAIKHDREKNIYKADIYILIRILGALYILNLYYKNQKIYLGKDKYHSNLDKTDGSSIFAYEIFPCIDEVVLDSEKNILKDDCIYKIIRKESDYALRINYIDVYDEEKSVLITMIRDEFQQYLKHNLGKQIKIAEIDNIDKILIEELVKNYNVKKTISATAEKMKSSYWLTLNKE